MRTAFSNINLKIRNTGYTMDNIEDLEYDVEAFTNSYNQQAVGPAKSKVFMEFMKGAIPKISKDVLTKEYEKQKINEDRLNQAIVILKEKNQMLEDNLKEMEDEHGMKQDEYEDLQVKLRKATKQEEILLKKAEEETEKRRDLMGDLANQKELNEELESQRKRAENELKQREDEFDIEQRDFRLKQAIGANISKEEASRIKEKSRQGGRILRTAQGVNMNDINFEERSDEDSGRNPQSTAEDAKKKKRKKIGGPNKGEGG